MQLYCSSFILDSNFSLSKRVINYSPRNLKKLLFLWQLKGMFFEGPHWPFPRQASDMNDRGGARRAILINSGHMDTDHPVDWVVRCVVGSQ